MGISAYQLDWKRPVTHAGPGERAYHATNGEQHILVVLTDGQIRLADKLARSMWERDREALVQDAVEEAIATALHRRPGVTGELRLVDSDFA